MAYNFHVDRVEMKIVGHRRLAILSLGALRQERPELLGALLGDQLAEPPGPQRLVAELLAPGPQPARRMMQRMLVGETHRAMHLMRNRCAVGGSFADPHLGDRDIEESPLACRPFERDRL